MGTTPLSDGVYEMAEVPQKLSLPFNRALPAWHQKAAMKRLVFSRQNKSPPFQKNAYICTPKTVFKKCGSSSVGRA